LLIGIFLLSFIPVLGVDTCMKLTTTGSYVLNNDIDMKKVDSSSYGFYCIEIKANDVTLDCQGHRIIGQSKSGGGITISNLYPNVIERVTIKNCKISNFHSGISINYGQHVNIANNDISSNREGISIGNGNNNNIANNDISSNGEGIGISHSTYNQIINNRISLNDEGIHILSSSNNVIYNNLFNNYQNVVLDWAPNNPPNLNTWNTDKTAGETIYGPGKYIGGNYWTTPTGNGHSDTCNDNGNCFCDQPMKLDDNNIDNLPLTFSCGCPENCCGNDGKTVLKKDKGGSLTCSNAFELCRYSETGTVCTTGAKDTGEIDYENKGSCTEYTGCKDGQCQSEMYPDRCENGFLVDYHAEGGVCKPEKVDCANPVWNPKFGLGWSCNDGKCVGCQGDFNCPSSDILEYATDIDHNGIINMIDIGKAANCFLCKENQPCWKNLKGGLTCEAANVDTSDTVDKSDTNPVGFQVIDMKDIGHISKDFGKTITNCHYNSCSDNKCILTGYYDKYTCNTGTGKCDHSQPACKPKPVGQNKVCTVDSSGKGIETDASSTYSCRSDNAPQPFCTEGLCSGFWHYAECDGNGNCDVNAENYFEPGQIFAPLGGYILDSDCNIKEGSCGKCGKCSGGSCTNEKECSPYEPGTRPCPGGSGDCAGTQTRTCNADCTWGLYGKCSTDGNKCGKCGTCSSGSCTNEKVCSVGYTESRSCGVTGDECAGTQTRTCNADCTWGYWGPCSTNGHWCSEASCGVCSNGICLGQGCSPGSTQSCPGGDCCVCTITCGSNCQWGSPDIQTGSCGDPRQECIDCNCVG